MIVLAVLLGVAAAFSGGACVYMYSGEDIATAVSVSKNQERNESKIEFYEVLPQQNVPTINSPFFGRAKELKEVKELIISNAVRIININGPPAFGKSRLANQLGHELLHHSGVIPNIRYIDTVTSRKSWYLCSTSTSQKQERNRYSDTHAVADTESPESSGQSVYDDNLCTLIAWQKKRTVLIFDNCDPILHSNDRKLFVDMLQTFLSMNVQIFNVVVVSQEKLFFLEDGFYSIHLEALSPMDSQAMLMHYVQNLTTTQANDLYAVVGGCPLALKVVAKLLCERNSLKSLLAKLKQNVTFTLSKKSTREEDQLHKVIDIAYKKYMDPLSRKCARVLSLFPGSMSEKMINSVLSEIVDPSCIEDVIRLSFLEEFSIEELRRFSIHTVIQGYLKSVHLIQSDIKAFNSSFLSFYSDYLTNAMKQSCMYDHRNISNKDSYLLNDLESHNMNEFVPMLLSTDIDEELTLYSAIALGFLIYEKRIPEAYTHDVFLKAHNLHSSSSIFDSICALSSKEVCTSILWKSFSLLVIQNECNSYFSFISNMFFAHPICSQLYNCSKLNPFDYQYTVLQEIVNQTEKSLLRGVILSNTKCKILTTLKWIMEFLAKWTLVINVLLILIVAAVVYKVSMISRDYLAIVMIAEACIFICVALNVLLYFPDHTDSYCQLYTEFWYDICISVSGYVEEWQCTHLPTSFINNTMSDMCNNTTTIVEEHGMSLVIINLITLFPKICVAQIIVPIAAFMFLSQEVGPEFLLVVVGYVIGSFIFGIGVLMLGCSAVSRFMTFSPVIFYTIYILIELLPISVLLFGCIIAHHEDAFESPLSNVNQNRTERIPLGLRMKPIFVCLLFAALCYVMMYYCAQFINYSSNGGLVHSL